MAFLSSLFGNNDSDSASANSSDFWSDFDAGLSVNYANESYHQEVDEDGSSETSYDATSFGTDLDIGSLIHSVTDSFESFDS